MKNELIMKDQVIKNWLYFILEASLLSGTCYLIFNKNINVAIIVLVINCWTQFVNVSELCKMAESQWMY